jgi:internalin A
MAKMTHRQLVDHILAHQDAVRLDLSGQGLTALPPELGRLTQLQFLHVSHNQLTALPPELGRLTQLQDLDVSHNQLTSLPPEMGNLTQLQHLAVFGNQLTTLPPELGRLTQLQFLHVSHNQLTALPPELGRLTRLQGLNVTGNQLTTLPPELGRLTQLQDLVVPGNQLTALPPELGRLTRLQFLHVSRNQLTSLPPELGRLTQLQDLYVSHNQLTALPPELRNLKNLLYLDIRGNPLAAQLPPEIIAKTGDPQAILSYYFSLAQAREEAAVRPLNEAKVLVLGQGKAGKTCVIKRLLYGKFNPQENKTDGIDIHRWQAGAGEEQIRLNVWDFGGQEILHATHQFFLTQRSLYLLVLDSRQDEESNRLQYWLKLIESFGAGSPVLVAATQGDVHPMELDWRGLQEDYPMIKDFVKRVSAKTGEGLEELKEKIAREVSQLGHVRDPLPDSWFAVKDELADMANRQKRKTDYLPFKRYEKMCQERQITEAEARRTLMGYLHDLGIALHYHQEHPDFVLNPEWVTNGVYKIIHSRVLSDQKGVLNLEDLGTILPKRRYPQDKYLFLLDLMSRFELLFAFPEAPRQKFLVPALLPKEEPYTGDWGDCLEFQYGYDVLPDSLISRFIVRMHAYIIQQTYWRTGALLHWEGNEALVKVEAREKKIIIRIRGPQPTRPFFLSLIRSHFGELNKSIKGLVVKEMIPLPGHPKVAANYNHLLKLAQKGQPEYVAEGLEEQPYAIPPLLHGFDPAEELAKALSPGSAAAGVSDRELLLRILETFRILAETLRTTVTAQEKPQIIEAAKQAEDAVKKGWFKQAMELLKNEVLKRIIDHLPGGLAAHGLYDIIMKFLSSREKG